MNALSHPVPEEIKEERYHRLLSVQQAISATRHKRRVGSEIEVVIDRLDGDHMAIGRSPSGAPEIDGTVRLFRSPPGMRVGETVSGARYRQR